MKMALFISLLALASCGDNPEEKTVNPLNEEITTNTQPVQPGSADYHNLSSICQSLSHLENRLNVLLTNRYRFSYATKSCEDEVISSPGALDVTISYSAGEYVFSKGNGELFAFPYVAANSNGVVEDICRALNSGLKNPMEFGNTVAMFTTAATANCRPDQQHVCVTIKQAGSDRKVHTSEWIKFKVMNERRGFFVERGIQTNADCAPGNWIERRAQLL